MSKYFLYRHFDKNEDLLYIGITSNIMNRTSAHKDSAWMAEVAKITIEHFETQEEGYKAEELAIKKEEPVFNKNCNASRLRKAKESFSTFKRVDIYDNILLGMRSACQFLDIKPSKMVAMLQLETAPTHSINLKGEVEFKVGALKNWIKASKK